MRAAWLGNAVRLAVEDGAEPYEWPHRTSPLHRSVPWSSSIHMPADAPWAAAPWRRAVEEPRPLLVAAAFSVPRGWTDARHPHMPRASRVLRVALNASCAMHGPPLCATLDAVNERRGGEGGGGTTKLEAQEAQEAQEVRVARLCTSDGELEPPRAVLLRYSRLRPCARRRPARDVLPAADGCASFAQPSTAARPTLPPPALLTTARRLHLA